MKVGDRVCCVKTHSQGVVKKGQVFTILNINNLECGCIQLDVGIIGDSIHGRCRCGVVYIKEYSIWWLNSSRFAPIQYESAHAALLNEIADNPKERIDIKEKELI